jgi:hypothetical protein
MRGFSLFMEGGNMQPYARQVEKHMKELFQPGELWTNRSLRQLSEDLTIDGFSLSPNTIDRLLREELGLGRRQAVKEVSLGDHPNRNDQFERIASLKSHFFQQGWPVISIDTKKKEILGDFFRPGYGRTDGLVRVFDHDFPSSGSGKVIPYGVYDLTANEGFMLLATGADTGELACDAIRRWWSRLGRWQHEGAPYLLALADSGDSNGYRVPLFRERLCQLARSLGVSIRVAHLPPYCSKYNPIDHRLFCHLSRSLRGVVCQSIEIIRDAFAGTTTSTGLRVVVEVARRVYQKGIKAAAEFRKDENTQRDVLLPKFNYVAPAE